jgi:hypothetical protein
MPPKSVDLIVGIKQDSQRRLKGCRDSFGVLKLLSLRPHYDNADRGEG